MRYEVTTGNFTHWCEAETPYQACMITFREHLEQRNFVPRNSFHAFNLESSEGEIIGLATVVALINLDANFEDLPEPPLDPNSPIVRAAAEG